MQHRADLVFDLCATLNQPAARRNKPTQHPRAFVTDPRARSSPRPAGRRAPWRRSCRSSPARGRSRTAWHARARPRRQWREDPGDRQRVAGGLHHEAVRRRQALPEQLQLLGRRRDLSGRSRPPASYTNGLTAAPARPRFSQSPCPATRRTYNSRPEVPSDSAEHSHAGTPTLGTRPAEATADQYHTTLA
jgi:hypothetical protein